MASAEKIENVEKQRPSPMFEGKNIHSSPIDGKLLCSFSEKTCMQRRLNHFAFCIRHVLEDKNAPFKQCQFVAKYNGQRCTNAIPVKEERIYCNSHLQVLGIVPKKSRKKKPHDQNDGSNKHLAKTSQAEILSCRASQNAATRRTEKPSGSVGASKPSPDEWALRKAKLLSSNPLLLQLVSTYSQANRHRRDLFSYYGLCSSDEDSLNSEDSGDECKLKMSETHSFAVRSGFKSEILETSTGSSRAARLQRLREYLCAELLNARKSISARTEDVKLSSNALGLLLESVKNNPTLAAVAIKNENSTFTPSSRKRSASTKPETIQCTAKTTENVECQRSALPYTKYCSRHIMIDCNQLLFHKCVTDVSPTSKCSVPALDLLYENPLCQDHATGKQVAYQPMSPPMAKTLAEAPLPPPKPAAKKPRRKPQVRASPTQKPVKPSKKTSRKEAQRMTKSEKNKRAVNMAPVAANVKPVKEREHVFVAHSDSRMDCEKSSDFLATDLDIPRQRSVDYISNGSIKLVSSPKNDVDVFEHDEFKEPGIFDTQGMDVDDSLENDDLNIPEDLGDISPTGMLRDTVLKLPLDLSESRGNPRIKLESQKSPVESYSMNPMVEGNRHRPADRVELPRNDDVSSNNKQYDSPGRINHVSIYPGVRPSRSSVITMPKFPSNPASLGRNQPKPSLPSTAGDLVAFAPMGPGTIKSEGVVKKAENRTMDLTQGPPLFPLPLDAVLNSSVSWQGGGKLVLNNRARPLLLTSQMNPATFSPPSLSPHISPQIALGTAFNFDRPSVLQHVSSSSPTLSPLSAGLPNSPHGKLPPRTVRLESRSNPSSGDMDPFFGASYDRP